MIEANDVADFAELNESRPYPNDPRCKYVLHGVQPKDEFSLPNNYSYDTFVLCVFHAISARVVRCDHSVDCVGYMFFLSKQKLLPEYLGTFHSFLLLNSSLQGLDGKTIGKLRRDGVEISTTVHTPVFSFLGDTTAQVFEVYENPSLSFSFPGPPRTFSSISHYC